MLDLQPIKEMYRLAVVGSREFYDREFVFSVLQNKKSSISLIVSGGASGPDTFAAQWARENGIPMQIFKPDWHQYGKSAGPIRNKIIIQNCDKLIAFWDGKSRGTLNSIDLARAVNKLDRVYTMKE